MKKGGVEDLHGLFAKHLIKYLGLKPTYSNDLTRIGRDMFGHKYIGTFPYDMLPSLKKNDYAIINLDDSTGSGSHWVAVVGLGAGNCFIYDSFGRKISNILPHLKMPKIITSENDAEQTAKGSDQNMCGLYSLAFLYIFNKYGLQKAKMI